MQSLDDPLAERREIYRLDDWLSESGLTGIITAKNQGDDPFVGEAQLKLAALSGRQDYLAGVLALFQIGRSRPGYSGRVEGDHAPVCVGGRGAAPPSFAGVQPATD
jgi:hypothetical protein